ncbi:3-methyladenine DNA glycosylase [Peptoniphilus harei]|jgi:DNA-3-methyladenine glycosylase|uniref:DNA-3-methyladenine glycosylase n=1 Tax=Peptoniphilus harei TaxID=54005 RepID=UPI000F6FA772|nr:DNA-3-methyladenine glycosylase [Peptoniphilus harei]MDU2373784.1 DNA-3-methyladenine glycosylase [Peptoniphilus harei]MDU5417108.1 DNA-3-methyladenine glycosylase [Peptoniphilus harei]MDU5470539.1 DNA-3-methyladenine glycosylase [Peptoniphilus harei]MDU6098316.1 DNA-3-methyladenine glycosylase [Peptoniphilus harei]QQE47573.1 DNA-3-methyladenine glycosylase [Peptoniphilus harei]
MTTGKILKNDFFKRDTVEVAKSLIGKKIIRNISGNFFCAKIVETEAYLGLEDRACHSYGGRITDRNKTLYLPGGHIYVYLIYGMYDLLNIVTRDEDHPEAVLIRGVEPLENLDGISKNRFGKAYEELSTYQRKNLSNGPGKLSMAIGINRSLNGKVLSKDYLYIGEGEEVPEKDLVITKRIGIDYAGEDADLPLRFCLRDNPYVSKK